MQIARHTRLPQRQGTIASRILHLVFTQGGVPVSQSHRIPSVDIPIVWTLVDYCDRNRKGPDPHLVTGLSPLDIRFVESGYTPAFVWLCHLLPSLHETAHEAVGVYSRRVVESQKVKVD